MAKLLRPSLPFIILLAACGPAAPQTPADLPTPLVFTTRVPTATIVPTNTAAVAQVSFDPASYRDESAGFELDYPSSWTADPPRVIGPRGYIAQITSWSRDPGEGFEGVPPGGTLLEVGVMLWDPRGDLDRYVEHRKQAWLGSNFEILSEEERILADDWRAAQLVVKVPFEEAFFLIAVVGDQYLVVSGYGDLTLLPEIAGTLRRIEAAP